MAQTPWNSSPERRLLGNLISQIDQQKPYSHVVIGNGDDAALLTGFCDGLVVSTDACVEGVHFLSAWDNWEGVGYRSVVAGLSDLAAMAAKPRGVCVTVGLGTPTGDFVWLERLYQGMGECLNQHQVPLVGGDLTASSERWIDVVSLGSAVPKSAARCSTAQPGDLVYVSGELGSAQGGLTLLNQPTLPRLAPLWEAFWRPVPRYREALALVQQHHITSLTDVSDGLACDAKKLAGVSGVSLEIDAARIPRSPALEQLAALINTPAWQIAITGGEDYELLFTSPQELPDTLQLSEQPPIPLTCVGRVCASGEGVFLIRDGERELLPELGYNHLNQGGRL